MENAQEQVIEQPQATEAAHETPIGKVSVGESVRAALEKSAQQEAAPVPKAEPKAEQRVRQPDGKFAKKAEQQEAAPESQPVVADKPEQDTVTDPAKPAVKPPQSLKGELKAEWDKLPPQWQGEIDRLEREAKKQIERTGTMANFGKSLADEFAPYEDMLRQAGATPQQALKSFLQTEYMLRTAPSAQKQAIAVNLLRHYGIDLSGILQGQQPPQIDPQTQALYEENSRLRREQAQRSNAESTQVISTIEQFAADPEHEHFQDVRTHMGVLIETGAAQTLDEAYEQACWANPTIRSKLIQSQQTQLEAQRKADERKAVEAKKAAAVSVRGAPAAPLAAVHKKESVGDTLRRVAAASGNRI